MPKPWAVSELTPQMPLSQAAAAILSVKLPEVLHYEAQAREGDIEGIHDMRIGAKRLREALRVFRAVLPDQHRRRLLPVVEQLNDALGLVRDRDVLILAFEKIMRHDPRTTPLRKLVAHLKRERAQLHRKLLATLDELAQAGVAKAYAAAMADLASAPDDRSTALAFAATAINERLLPVLDNMEVVHCPVDEADFHRQRIRVKKLKYALEPFLTILSAEIEPIYKHLSVLQELMGDVHDVDVQTALIKWWEQREGTAPGLSAGLDALAQRRRELAYETRRYVELLEAEDFAGRLRGVLGI